MDLTISTELLEAEKQHLKEDRELYLECLNYETLADRCLNYLRSTDSKQEEIERKIRDGLILYYHVYKHVIKDREVPAKSKNKIELKQTFPGSWDQIDIIVDGVKRFGAGKQGTNFWSISVIDGNRETIGFGEGRSEVKKIVQKFLKTEALKKTVAESKITL